MNKLHEKLVDTSITFANKFPYYSEFMYAFNVTEDEKFPTAGVCVNRRGFNLIYKPSFIDMLTDKQCTFLMMHEINHLIFNHCDRAHGYIQTIANLVMDMIINSLIVKEIESKYIDPINNEIAKAWFVPPEYEGEWIFELLYDWLMNEKPSKDKSEETNDLLQKIQDAQKDAEKLKEAIGKLLDEHLEDEIDAELKESMVNDLLEKCRHRGYVTGAFEKLLEGLRKPKKDYLKELKRSVSAIVGQNKVASWMRPNRKGLPMKGYKKFKTAINVLLDTSGSMSGDFDKVLSYIFRNDIEINLVQNDTEVKAVEKIKNKNQLKKLTIKGLGGTQLRPGIDYIETHYNKFGTVILTDGQTDSLDTSKLKKKVLILTTTDFCPITAGKVKQIKLDQDRKSK